MSWSNRNARAVGRRVAAALGLAVLFAGGLAGCGFEPLYKPHAQGGSVSADLATVDIAVIADRSGQILRNQLRDEINPYGRPSSPRYRLDVRLSETRRELGLREDDVRTRANLAIGASYTLVALADGKAVLSGQTRTTSSFNLLLNDYATLVAEQDARSQALREIGAEIRTRLALYFRRQAVAG